MHEQRRQGEKTEWNGSKSARRSVSISLRSTRSSNLLLSVGLFPNKPSFAALSLRTAAGSCLNNDRIRKDNNLQHRQPCVFMHASFVCYKKEQAGRGFSLKRVVVHVRLSVCPVAYGHSDKSEWRKNTQDRKFKWISSRIWQMLEMNFTTCQNKQSSAGGSHRDGQRGIGDGWKIAYRTLCSLAISFNSAALNAYGSHAGQHTHTERERDGERDWEMYANTCSDK